MGFFGLDSRDKKKDGGLGAFGQGIGLKYNGFGEVPFSIDHSFLLDGVNEYFTAIDYTKINPYVTGVNTDFTILFSYKRNTSSGFNLPFGNSATVSSLTIQFANGSVQLLQRDAGVLKKLTTTDSYGSTAIWHHAAFVVSGSNPVNNKILMNDVASVLVLNELTGNVDSSTTNFQYGSYGAGGLPHNGYLGAFAIVNRNLTALELTDWYNVGKPKDPQSLFGTDCKLFLNPDNSGSTSQFVITDSINGITATSVNMEDADKTTTTPY